MHDGAQTEGAVAAALDEASIQGSLEELCGAVLDVARQTQVVGEPIDRPLSCDDGSVWAACVAHPLQSLDQAPRIPLGRLPDDRRADPAVAQEVVHRATDAVHVSPGPVLHQAMVTSCQARRKRPRWCGASGDHH